MGFSTLANIYKEEEEINLAWVSAITISHLWSPSGSLSFFDNRTPVSVISNHSKLDGHDAIVPIHSLVPHKLICSSNTDEISLFNQSYNSNS